jgi:hypothetical protein
MVPIGSSSPSSLAYALLYSTISNANSPNVNAHWNSSLLKAFSKEAEKEGLASLLNQWKRSLRDTSNFIAFLRHYEKNYSSLVKEVFYDLIYHKVVDRSAFFYEATEQYILHSTESIGTLLVDFVSQQTLSAPVGAIMNTIRKFMGNFYSFYIQSANDAEQEMDKAFEKFTILVSQWFDAIPELCQTLFEPKVMSMHLSLLSSSRLRMILAIHYKAFTDLNMGKFQISSPDLVDELWARHLNRLADLCWSSNLLKTFVQTCDIVLKSLMPTHQSFGNALLASVLSLIEKSDSEMLLELLLSCSKSQRFVHDVEPYLKRWMIFKTHSKALLQVFQVWHEMSPSKSLDGRLFYILGELIHGNNDESRLALLILDQIPPNEIVDLIPKLANCLKHSSTRDTVGNILRKQKERLNQGSGTPGRVWMEAMVQEVVERNSDSPGTQALMREAVRVKFMDA